MMRLRLVQTTGLWLIVLCILAPRCRGAADFQLLHSFSGPDGRQSFGQLVVSNATIYGAAPYGGTNDDGLIFSVAASGSNYTALHKFTGADGSIPTPLAPLGYALFGAARQGGTNGAGAVFVLNNDGSNFKVLHAFGGADGKEPGEVVAANYFVYGETFLGGANNSGVIYSMGIDGYRFKVLKSFSALSDDLSTATNEDGALPSAGMLLNGSTLYGVTEVGGSGSTGVVYSMQTDGSGFAVLKNFSATVPDSVLGTAINEDGATPECKLALAGRTLFGGTASGGAGGDGVVFSVGVSGAGFRVLHTFSALAFDRSINAHTNVDGARVTGLTLADNTLYGTTAEGGAFGSGVVFSMDTNGGNLTVLKAFPASTSLGGFPYETNSEGVSAEPVVLSGRTLFGAALQGGVSGGGALFSLALPVPPPQLTRLSLAQSQVVILQANSLPYSTNLLQAANSLGPFGSWQTISTNVARPDGNWGFTDYASTNAAARFYRAVTLH
jgi:uncharacterized repeat protein (TIGR03803 family)